MFYQLYEMNHAAMAPLRATADAMRLAFRNPLNPLTHTVIGRTMAAGFEVIERNTRRYGKPEFGLPTTVIDGSPVKITEEVTWSKPFCNLIHFNRSLTQPRSNDPKILIVAPMSGHYATLLRGTVEALLPSADVYITDWIDARMVPMTDGTFDFDDYVDYVIEILHHLGPNTNLVAVCQPSVPVLAAVARMEAENDEFVPSSMTLMGGPIDTRINPTAVNELAKNKPIEWFEENVIMNVPWPQPGFLRPVYPGFLQLSGFMSMNLDRHMIAQKDFYVHLVKNNGDSAEKHREFYDEYLSVMDLTAEFYLQTVEAVFMRHSLPKGELMHRGKPVDCGAIRNVALLTVEGENDDISGVGQTKAAQTLCTNLADDKRMHYMQPDVGHYGVFTGSRFRREIAPRIVAFAKQHSNQPTSAVKRATMVKRVIKGGKST
ncbi:MULTISPECIES: polyhydroxyalkanoate depolymerase [Rhizobium/Agrobacterium group]|uniref:Intracellular PHB depolymerase n=2 Tax=Rhizobium/Agrobacterium group TaxID=227290 RepID=B9JXV2_ALLAM|nr:MULTISPECIES: polyhydroxyalkanoate depolymerase [Rhizobium/Agrobacterium group]ACM34982.1 intracellular PHB depolymerase [Allorhizobium ampelinum S4]MCF1491899.1 polyhydroxyalkanoate depolymerase [Allorhizobium ampelinum]MUO28726.1 polyhydroxyalkanoate depolymerase [Agrobacterium vitis]MUO42682.1 polyhydroxyalkanoate depolymerase [Agrobacterium vitis]MUP09696.1 polyhydroxyalkanoate depolymerase [Agrobacterium vitis]